MVHKRDTMRYVALLFLPGLVLCTDNSTTTLNNLTLSTNSSSLIPNFTTENSSKYPRVAIDNSSSEAVANYGFYRKITWGQELLGNNCSFEGASGKLAEFAAACVLLNEHFSPTCSAAVVKPRWAITAAHCLTTGVSYVLYNAERSSSSEGDIMKVLHIYRHPQFEVEERDDGEGLGVDTLLHDVGLVYVAKDMKLKSKLQTDPLVAMRMYKPAEMKEHELQVMAFGHTSTLSSREELFSVKMRMVNCTSLRWFHCICGIPSNGKVSVCMADSGGPVLYRGVQVAVTSMGPMSCASSCAQPSAFATSVFTVLYPYADLINDTIHNTRHAIQMVKLTDEAFSVSSKLIHVVLGLFLCSCIRLSVA